MQEQRIQIHYSAYYLDQIEYKQNIHYNPTRNDLSHIRLMTNKHRNEVITTARDYSCDKLSTLLRHSSC